MEISDNGQITIFTDSPQWPGISIRTLPLPSANFKRRGHGLNILIPAAGHSKKMKWLAPKPLVEVNGKTILDRQLCIFNELYPSADIVMVTGHESELIQNTLPKKVCAVENEFHAFTGVARSIKLGLRACRNTKILLIYSDLVFNMETLTGMPTKKSWIIVDNQKRIRDEEVGVTVIDGSATVFGYGLPTKWGQIAYLTGKELELFCRATTHLNHTRYLGFELLNAILAEGGSLLAIEPEGMRLAEVDSPKDLEAAQKIF